jgi:RNA polymerase sigma-70 factor (ECF subfamily)
MLNFSDLYESYAAEVYRFALWLCGDGSESEDITSETFIRAWAHNSKIRTETLKAYLFTIARNVYLEMQRKDKNHVNFDLDYPDPAPEPDSVVESKFDLHRIRRHLQTFPEVDQSAFVLRVQHELPYAEIARILGISVPAAKVKVHRVRRKILALFFDEEVH